MNKTVTIEVQVTELTKPQLFKLYNEKRLNFWNTRGSVAIMSALDAELRVIENELEERVLG